MSTKTIKLLIAVILLTLIVPVSASGHSHSRKVQATLLHTNDFHGRLQTDSNNRGGSAYIAGKVNDIRHDKGEKNVLLLDAGDEYFAAPAISQLLMGESTVDIYNMMDYDLAVFGNHEFDKGQEELAARVDQSEYDWLGANVVLEGTDWDLPAWAEPYEILKLGKGKTAVKLGVLGLAGEETPEVTLIGTTEGLVFKDLTETVLHYYDKVLSKSDALILVVHMGTEDSGPYDGLVTLAQNLIDAGKPVDLIIGGHQHQALFDPVYVGDTAIVSAGYYGRLLGQIDVSIDKRAKKLTVDNYQLHTITAEATIEGLLASLEEYYEAGEIDNHGIYNSLHKKLEKALSDLADDDGRDAYNSIRSFAKKVRAQSGKHISTKAADSLLADARWILENTDFEVAARVAHWAEIVAPIVDEPVGYTNISLALDYNDESLVGDIVTDSMLWSADLYDDGELNDSVDVAFTNPGGLRAEIIIPDGATLPHVVTWGDTFDVLPFGDTLYLMDLTGAQIQTLLDQSANLYKGILQTSGASWYWYNDCGCITPTAWGAYGVTVDGQPLVRDEVYRVVTNNFLAGGQDGWTTFADGTNRWDTYYDMQEGFVEYIKMLDVIDAEDIPMDRIIRLDDVVTMLHTNDTHGTWPETYYYGDPEGFAFLASQIKAERARNPNLLLLDAGDTFQGNAFAQYFRDAVPNPIAGGMNLLGYDAFTIGNHEFNFGPATFATMLGQLDAPILGTINLDDDGGYGFINENVKDYINLVDANGKKVTVFGLTNPRVYRYELPTNIPGLTFYSGLEKGFEAVPQILNDEMPDVLVGLTHMGYEPYGDEIDSDVLLAEGVAGIDVIIGGHSHTFLNPSQMVTSDINPDGTLIAQAGRYALNLGKVNVGFIGDEIVLREGYLLPAAEVPVDDDMVAYLQPFEEALDAYTGTELGQTTAPIDALQAYTQETSGANLQADSAVFELTDNGIEVDFHLSGAMSDRKVADGATPASPVTLTVNDMYTLMPYENSLLVMSMNGPQIKEVLERGYRNWWWYNQGSPWGGYSHYTTCMLATDAGNVITYTGDLLTEPDGNNVASLTLDGAPVDFDDAGTSYNVSTVNYLAAGSCNFNNAGVTIWPLDQIVADTQFYVRDSVIHYVEAQVGPIAPAIEGRLVLPTP